MARKNIAQKRKGGQFGNSLETGAMDVAEEVPDAETPDDEEPPTYPNMDLAQTVFQLEAAAPAELDGLRAQIVEVVRADKMAPYYTYLIGKYGFAADDALLAELK